LFLEWAKPQGLCDTLQTIVLRDVGRIGVFAGHRHESEGTATDADVELLRLLAPHIRRAVTISDLMDLKALERQALVATLDNLAAGVLIVANDSRILHVNRAAERMLGGSGSLHVINGRLTARDGDDALVEALEMAGRNEAAIGGAGIGVALKSAAGAPIVAHVLPLSRGDLRTRLIPRATAAVFLIDASEPLALSITAVAESFGLTRSESRLLAQLALGSTIASAAVALGIAETTTKTHLAHIFAKTGLSRQADLIALVHRLASPARNPETAN
jgi:DNA-binding CsgD family transcriptional regulator/PAS domain-containing protein